MCVCVCVEGVGALCARAAVMGAFLNVSTNIKDLKDSDYAKAKREEALKIVESASALEAEVASIVEKKIAGN